jgi:hypothetical protein
MKMFVLTSKEKLLPSSLLYKMQVYPKLVNYLPDCTELRASKLNSLHFPPPEVQIIHIILYTLKVSVWLRAWKQLDFMQFDRLY